MKLTWFLTAIVPALLYADIVVERNASSDDCDDELAQNEDMDASADQMEESCPEQSSTGRYPKASRVGARHIEANGIGYREGYTTVEGFFMPSAWINNFIVPFLDVRAHIFNNGQPAVNAGLGVRLGDERVYGANIYYDYRKTHKMHYNQVAGGLESLGENWDFRINGYFPVGKRKILPGYQFKKFSGNRMILTQKREVGMLGGNAEVGYHLDAFENMPLYFAAGPYYFTGQSRNAIGGEARANIKFYDYFGLQVSGFYDSVFHGGVQGEVSINYPFGARQKGEKRSRSIAYRLVQPVDRNEIIVVNQKHKHSVARDSATGDVLNFLFVDNLSHSLGTIESPYSDLPTAIANSNVGDVLYVFPGDGTSTGLTGSMQLLDNQRLLGSGVTHNFNTTKGIVRVPVQQVGLPALYANTGDDVMSLGNNCEMSGFKVTSTDGGVFAGFVSNPSVNRNVIAASGRGVDMENTTGTTTVIDNTLQNTVTGIGASAIFISSCENIVVQNNLIMNTSNTGTYGAGININGATAVTGQTLSTLITNNIVSLNVDLGGSAGFGIQYSRSPQDNHTLTISNNQVLTATSTSTDGAIQVVEQASPTGVLCAQIFGNVVSQPTGVNAYTFINSNSDPGHFQLTTFSNNIGAPMIVTGSISTGPCP